MEEKGRGEEESRGRVEGKKRKEEERRGKKRKEEERRGRGNSHCMVSQTSFTKISLILFDFVRRCASTLQPTHFLRHTIRITDLHNNSSGQFEVPVKPGVPNSSTIGLHPHCNVAQLCAWAPRFHLMWRCIDKVNVHLLPTITAGHPPALNHHPSVRMGDRFRIQLGLIQIFSLQQLGDTQFISSSNRFIRKHQTL